MATNETLVETMEMTNIGGSPMMFYITESADWLFLDQTSGTITQGSSVTIELTLIPLT